MFMLKKSFICFWDFAFCFLLLGFCPLQSR